MIYFNASACAGAKLDSVGEVVEIKHIICTVRPFSDLAKLIKCLKGHGVMAIFRYIPLCSSSEWGMFNNCSHDESVYTTSGGSCQERLPKYYLMTLDVRQTVVNSVKGALV